MNDLYNAQDKILFCKIVENRFQSMHDENGFNRRKCNSASTLSCYISREMSRVIITFPTSNEIVDIFEHAFTGSFSSVNTRIAFDTEILLPNTTKGKTDEFNKDYDYKVCYQIRLNNEKEYSTKTVITKIVKLDKKNQYGYGMTKPLPTGCIKQNTEISWRSFNLLLEKVSFDDQIGHLYVVDIDFDHTKATKRQIVYNEIYPSIIEKQKIIDPCERSLYQLLEQLSTTSKGSPKTDRTTKKPHATMFNKKNSTDVFRTTLLCY